MLGPQFTVFTQHGEGREARTVDFEDFDAALSHARSKTPDTDGTMVPNVDESLSDHPGYEKGVFWNKNRYAVILKKGR